MIREIDNLVVTQHRLITPVGVIEGSRGLSEATPPDIVAGHIVDPEAILGTQLFIVSTAVGGGCAAG